MNQNPSSSYASSSGDGANERIMNTLKASDMKRRLITGIAMVLGLLSIMAGIVMTWAIIVFILPKEREVFHDYPIKVQEARGKPVPADAPQDEQAYLPKADLNDLNQDMVFVAMAHQKALALIAMTITLLGVGAFATLILVIFNRRVTLNQINASLAQISEQIKELQSGGKG